MLKVLFISRNRTMEILQNVSIAGNLLTYAPYNGDAELGNVIVWDVVGNCGMGPPSVVIRPGSTQTTLSVTMPGGVLVTLKNPRQGMMQLCKPFVTSQWSPVVPIFSPGPGPIVGGTNVGTCPPSLGNPASNEIELDGRCLTLQPEDFGKLWFFSSQKEGAQIVLPVLSTVGATVRLYNWASKEGYGPETANPITICLKEPNGGVHPMFPIMPGQGQQFIAIRGSSGGLRWAPIGF